MFSNLLVASDGSEHATRAVDVAIDLAQNYKAKLHIVHVLTRDIPSKDLEHMIEAEHLDDSCHAGSVSHKVMQRAQCSVLTVR
jgi:nucleotide-binding universal stress UspA family protein